MGMEKVTFKEAIAAILGGIWFVILWFIGLFGFKDESPYGKRLKKVFATCATILLALLIGILVYAFSTEIVYEKWLRPYVNKRVWSEQHISPQLVFQQMYYPDKSRVYDKNQNKVVLDGIDWMVTSDDTDSLAVYSKNGKRGYINRFTGKIAIPELYTRAAHGL